jgi:5'-nucleotidase
MKRRKLDILLTNDDGIDAPGLRALIGPLSAMGRLAIAAPAVETSGISHSITIREEIPVKRGKLPGGVRLFAIGGYPADCIKLAVDRLLPRKPDLVVSGVNLGANIGSHVFYSGTVAAAVEASLLGIHAVAVSLVTSPRPDFDRAAGVFADVLTMLLELEHGPSPVFNVNIPPSDVKLRGIRFTAQCAHPMPDTYERRRVRGREEYHITCDEAFFHSDDVSDRRLLREGYVTVTPLRCDLTCHETLARILRKGGLKLPKWAAGKATAVLPQRRKGRKEA